MLVDEVFATNENSDAVNATDLAEITGSLVTLIAQGGGASGTGVVVEASGTITVPRARAATTVSFDVPSRKAVELGVFRLPSRR